MYKINYRLLSCAPLRPLYSAKDHSVALLTDVSHVTRIRRDWRTSIFVDRRDVTLSVFLLFASAGRNYNTLSLRLHFAVDVDTSCAHRLDRPTDRRPTRRPIKGAFGSRRPRPDSRDVQCARGGLLFNIILASNRSVLWIIILIQFAHAR